MGNSSTICPKCNQELSGELEFCPFDGTRLNQNVFDNFCLACEKQYSSEFQSCPVHGEKLTPFTLPPADLEAEYDEGGEVMDEKALDSFARGLCPKCDAWKNWEQLGNEYTCQTCMESFTYQDGQLKGSKTKTVFQVERERLEALPYASVLSAIDESNKKYWLPEFDKFDSSPNHKQWNWPTFFFLPHRYLWKGMWKKGLLIHAIIIGSLFLIDALDALMTPAWLSYSNSKRDQSPLFFILWLMTGIAIKVYFASNGAKDYHKHIKSFEGDLGKAKTHLITGRILLPIAFIVANVFYIFIRK